MEITGKIIAILPAKQGVTKDGNAWASQEYVIETEDQYPKRCCFRVFGSDKIAKFAIRLHEVITVSFDINCREYQGKWFNDINAWKVDRETTEEPIQVTSNPQPVLPVQQVNTAAANGDDLPF